MSDKLVNYLAKLKAAQLAAPQVADDAIVFWGTNNDTPYLPQLKSCAAGATVYVRTEEVITITQVTGYCAAKRVTRVLTTSDKLLRKLLNWQERAAPSVNDYSGSLFKVGDIEIVFLRPLSSLVTVSYGRFLAARLISKFTKPNSWFPTSKFTGYTLLTALNHNELFAEFSTAHIISIDIETFREDATIRCLSYTAGWFRDAELETKSIILPMDSEFNLALMRKFNWELKAPKVFQNGKYDIAYFARYSAPVYAYLFDTAHLMHSWHSELPKDLGFLNAFFLREAMYWKDLADTIDLDQYYRYNALDTWGTLNCFLAMLAEAPQYAINNYLLEFPLVFPCHLSEMTGIKRDMKVLKEAKVEVEEAIAKDQASLDTILAIPKGFTFNVSSPKQMKQLLKLIGCGDLPSTDEKNLNKARFRHPLNARILNLVIKIRKNRKLLSTYLTEGKEFSYLGKDTGRVLFALNPHGTDSGRLASREHHFWCGINIQNIPRGPAVKKTYVADTGFLLAECDLEQAESRDTAYISGDSQLMINVEESPDFHKSNASMFFGVPFEEVTKELRTLGKPVNHGANYNMGAYVLIDTMGEENIIKAKRLLNLNRAWTTVAVAQYLLDQFHRVYPTIKSVYYRGVVNEVCTTARLESLAVHWSPSINKADVPSMAKQLGEEYLKVIDTTPRWTRSCFGNPQNSKPVLNSYISHPPQSLNAMTLNKAYLAVFNNIAIHPEHSKNFKLIAQIHDSILFQYRVGHEYLCDMVEHLMEIPVTVRAYDNEVRTFIVPAGVKRGQNLPAPNTNKARYWSETE